LQPNLTLLAEKLGYAKLDEVYGAMGHGELSTRSLANAIESFAPPPPADVEPESIIRASRAAMTLAAS
jgi:GTP pyrophosphokinase